MNISKILLEFETEKKNILPSLQKINDAFGYISEENAKIAADYFSVPLSKIYEMASFFDLIKTKKQPELIVQVCSSTNCAFGNSFAIVKEIENILRVKAGGENNPKIKLETVSCLGRCGEGPIVVVNGKVYEKVNISKAHEILEEYI